MYRYRLSDHKVNKGLDTRSLNGMSVFRKRWLYSDRPLFQEPSNKPLVIEETAESKQEFADRDQKRRAQIEAQKKKKSHRETLQEIDLNTLTHEQAHSHALELGFPEYELQGLDREQLIALIGLDLTM